MKKSLQKILAIAASGLLLLGISGCSKDLEKTKYKEEVDIELTTEPTSISALEEEITEIAHKYDENGVLTQAMAIFQDKQIQSELGELHYTFCSEDKEKERGTIIIVTYDMAEGKVTEVSYEQGYGKFTLTTKEPIHQEAKTILFSSIFEMLRNDNSMGPKLAGANIRLTVEFTSEGLKPSLI